MFWGTDVNPEAYVTRESSDLGPMYCKRRISYRRDMTTETFTPGHSAAGSTALGTHSDHPRHLLGSTLRAVRVFAQTAVEVVLLGSEGKHR